MHPGVRAGGTVGVELPQGGQGGQGRGVSLCCKPQPQGDRRQERTAHATDPRVTLLTLARDLGVSRATVSNAYNRPDQLSPALRARILARAAELGFAGPDAMARGLRRGRVGAIGVLVDEGLSYAFSDPTAVLFLDGLAREVQADGLGLLLHAGAAEGSDLEHIRDAAVDAWVVQSLPDGHPAVAAAQARGRPLVVLDQPALPGVPLVGIDDEAGAAAALEHVLGLGHRRLAGAAAAAAAAGLEWAQITVLECSANDVDGGTRAAERLLTDPAPPTAVFALSDQLALGVLRAAHDAGVRVPEQLSVVGFDDSPPARTTHPALTTVAQPLRERGQAVGALVRALLRGKPGTPPAPYPVRLVPRASSTAPPSALTPRERDAE